MNRQAWVVTFVALCACAQGADITRMIRRISSDGAACGPPSVECDGGFERFMYNTTNGISNVIPQEANVLLEYDGDLADNKWVSLVGTHLAADPCAAGGIAAAVADNVHSGVVQGTGLSGTGSGKLVKIPQDTQARVLDSTQIYAVCYSSTGPLSTDTWVNTGIEIRISKLSYVTTYATSFRTDGTIPNCGASTGQGGCASLTMRYFGTILNDRWLSLVDSTLNSGQPCGLGYLVGSGSGTSASTGSLPAAGNVVRFDTAALDGTLTYAVCYAESGGIQSSIWRDSGLRLLRSKVTSVKYGVDTDKFGSGFERVWRNRHTDQHMPIPTDQFPRVQGAQLEYVGELASGKHLSLVDDTLGSNHPCRYPQIAAGSASGAGSSDLRVQSGVASAGSGSSKVVVDQSAGNLLDSSKRYAVCYAEGDGTSSDSTWADSYVRVGITLLEGVAHHGVMHATTGMLPNTGDRVDDDGRCTGINSGDCNLLLKFTGSLGVVDTHISIVEEVRSSITVATSQTQSITAYVPCSGTTDSDHNVASSLYTGIISTSATMAAQAAHSYVYSGELLVDTRQLDTGTIVSGSPPTFTPTMFGVCYKESSGGTWRDSGIRLSVGKLQEIKYGASPTSGTDPYAQWVMKPVDTSLMLSASCPSCPESGLSNARNVLPQVAGEQFTYVSHSGGGNEGIQGTALSGGEWISLVDATFNSNKPCVLATEAAAQADSSHSGVMQTAFSATVTVPQATTSSLLGHDKLFAVCYAVIDGTVADSSWADSYVRLSVSKVKSIASLGVTHSVNNYIATIAHRDATVDINSFYYSTTLQSMLDLTFEGSLASTGKLALVDHELGIPAHFPCTKHAVAGNSSVTSGVSPGVRSEVLTATDSTVRLVTSTLWSNRTFALCYSLSGDSWFDTGVRVERSKVASVNYDMDVYNNLPRVMTSLFFDTNLIPQEPDILLTYIGDLEDYKGISLVASSQNNGNPCVDGSIAAMDPLIGGPAGARISSGVDTYPDTTRSPKIYQSGTNQLDETLIFAVCYSETQIDDAAAAYNWQWRDSYIRLRVTKLYSLSQNLGKWPGVAGSTITHKQFGQLPYMGDGWTGLDITMDGSLAADAWISLVDSTESSTATVAHGVTYYHPCTTASFAGSPADSTHSGPVQANSSVISTLDTTILDPNSKTYALCYAEGGVGDATGYAWKDSGMRFTISKIQKVQYSSGHVGTPQKDMDSVFRMTNRLPQKEYTTITYVGDAQLSSGLWFSIVRANDDSTAVTHNNNPCMDNTYAVAGNGGASNVYSAVMTGGGSSGYDLTLQQTTAATTLDYSTANFNEGFTYALCYSEFGDGAVSSHVWADSYIRFQMSMIASISTYGIQHQTTGQIPNVFAADNFRFYYNEDLAHSYLDKDNAWLALVDETLNQAVPCVGTQAGVSSASTDYTGAHRTYVSSGAYEQYVQDFDTNSLDVSKVYALCYSSGSDYSTMGGVNDPTWADSGLRLTLPKVHTMLFKSGYNGPAYTAAETYSGDSKLDTKPREMTSFELATNYLPADINQELEYVGVLPTGNWISLVATSRNSGNPCVHPGQAGGSATQHRSSPIAATNRVVVIPQTAVRLLHTETFAVCYSDGDGSTTDYSWRDSYIRLHISRITSFNVLLSQMPVSNTFETLPIKTHGQLAAQSPNQQVSYGYSNPDLYADSRVADVGPAWSGSAVGAYKWIWLSLVDATLNEVLDPVTGRVTADPCGDARVEYTPYDSGCSVTDYVTQSNCDHSGYHKTTDLETGVTTIDTNKLDSDKVYALCWSDSTDTLLDTPIPAETPGWKPGNFSETGIRLTTPAVHTIHYMDLRFGNPTVFNHQTRKLTSIVSAVNTMPSPNPSMQVTYEGSLAPNNWLSLVDATLNSHNPCVNPSDAAAGNVDSGHSGAFQAGASDTDVIFASGGVWNYPLGINNNYPSRFAICYASGDGSTTDDSWRDSYIRVTLSQIENIVAYKVTHRIGGQIPNHQELKVDYAGYLPNNKYVALVDETLEPMMIGLVESAFPCAWNNRSNPAYSPQTVHAADDQHSGTLQAGTSHYPTSKVVQIDTSGLDTKKNFAFCYSDGVNCDVEDCEWYDSGLRVTTPAIINLKMDSGWSGITNPTGNGIPARHHTSWDQISGSEILDRPTSRLPQLDEAMKFEYQVHNSSNVSTHIGSLFAFVDVSVDVVTGYGEQNNPCVKAVDIGSGIVREPETDVAASGVATERLHSGVIQAKNYDDDAVGNIVVVPESEITSGVRINFLDPTKTYAVCYRSCVKDIVVGCDSDPACQCQGRMDVGSSGSSAPRWEDSYIRFKMTKVKQIITIGVTHRTVGQIHSMTPVSSRAITDGVYVEYQGSLSQSSFLSLVDDTVNPQQNGEGMPCDPLYATALSPATSYTGGKQAPSTSQASGDDTYRIRQFDTRSLDTTKTFAVCYSENNVNWFDSGIRVTVAAVHTIMYSSGHTGPEDKPETMSRSMSCVPRADNRLPQEANFNLTYAGDMLANRWISLVDASLNDGNPCVYGGTAAALGASGGDMAQYSGPSLAASGSKLVTVIDASESSSGNLLRADGTIFAVCYDAGMAPTFATSPVDTISGVIGSTTSSTWRDSYVRLKISKLSSFKVQIPTDPATSTFSELSILTFGQIPNSAYNGHVSYSYTGTALGNTYISLVDIDAKSDLIHGVSYGNPCEHANYAKTEPTGGAVAGENRYSGVSDACGPVSLQSTSCSAGNSDRVVRIDSTTPYIRNVSHTSFCDGVIGCASPGLSPQLIYAVCYSSTNSDHDYEWFDSGIRVSPTALAGLEYYGDPVTLPSRMRPMASRSSALHRLPRAINQKLTFTGELAAGSWVSLVDANSNSGVYGASPCANPAIAAGAASQYQSGPVQSDSNNEFIIPQSVLFAKTSVFAVCYSDYGTTTDTTWRESYMRVSISSVETVSAMKVTHRTTGQLADHPALVLTYQGTLVDNSHLSLVDATLNQITTATSEYQSSGYVDLTSDPYPCISSIYTEHTPDADHTGSLTASGSEVTFNSQPLNRPNERYYAVCYAAAGTGVWEDSGIRVTLSAVTELLYASSHSGPSDKPDTMPRHMTSDPRATNRLPRYSAITLTYVTHDLSYMAGSAGQDAWISVVDASLNSNNPCVLGTFAAEDPLNGGSSNQRQHTGASRAQSLTKDVPFTGGEWQTAGNYLATSTEFAVCYATVDGTTSDTSWQDSYIRLYTSEIYSFSALGVTHRTLGQIPWSPASDQLEYTYTGSLAANARVSLVDSTLNGGFPCDSGADAAHLVDGSGSYSGWYQASLSTLSTLDTTVLDPSKNFALCYSTDVTVPGYYTYPGDIYPTYVPGTWSDSGIRLTVPKLHSLALHSGYTEPGQWASRIMTSFPLSTNRIARAENQTFEYSGTLADGSVVSIIDAARANAFGFGYNPCVNPDYAAALPNFECESNDCPNGRHYTGAVNATGKVFTIPQNLASEDLLYEGTYGEREYAVCYAEGRGDIYDNTWRDSYIRLKASQLEALTSKGVTHRTLGQLPHHVAGIDYTMVGPLTALADKWISFVLANSTVMSGGSADYFGREVYNPCGSPSQADHVADEHHTVKSRALPASAVIDTMDTTGLSKTSEFALCYSSDALHLTAPHWFDSGLRITISKISGIEFSGYTRMYAEAHGKPHRLIQSVEQNLQAQDQVVANVLPQMTDMAFVYVGDLKVSSYVSLVAVKDTSAFNRMNPCVDAALTGGSADAYKSGAVRSCQSNNCDLAGQGATANGNKEVVVPQNTLLDSTEEFAVCYSDGDGSSSDSKWRDSYIRVSMSKVNSISADSVRHYDHGQIADYNDVVPLQIQYNGSLADGMWMSLVNENFNNNNPCATSNTTFDNGTTTYLTIAADAPSGNSSGAQQATGSVVSMDTSMLSTETQFAVCYAESTGFSNDSTWRDSGVRVMKSTIHTLKYNEAQLPSNQFQRSITAGRAAVGSGRYLQELNHLTLHKLPQAAANSAVSSALDLSYSGNAGGGIFVSFVDASINNNNPCVLAAEAGHAPGGTHTGPIESTPMNTFNFSNAVIAGLSSLQSGSQKKYALCYNLVHGGTYDFTYTGMGKQPVSWRDSYLRVSFSLVESVSNHQVVHRTQGHIANNAAFGLTYTGNLGTGMWLSLVDDYQGGSGDRGHDNPCIEGNSAASNFHSGPTQAAAGTKQVIIDTTALATSANFAVCYSNNGVHWYDSAIRVTLSKVTSISYNLDQPVAVTGDYLRQMTSLNTYPATDEFPVGTNRLPQKAAIPLTFEGNVVANPATIGNSIGKETFFSFAQASENMHNPCANTQIAGLQTATQYHSGVMKEQSGFIPLERRELNMTQSPFLEAGMIAALCYSTGEFNATSDGTPLDPMWRDSYIRVQFTRVVGLVSYGIEHITTGMIASKPALRVAVDGSLTGGAVSLVDASLNLHQPCSAAHASLSPSTNAELLQYSGISTAVSSNKHTVQTNELSAAAELALCYAEGTGDANDATWTDSGLRLYTPKVTQLLYSAPARVITAESCFGDIDLFGRATCLKEVSCTGADCTVSSNSTSCGPDGSVDCPIIPRHIDTTLTYGGPASITVPTGITLSLVEHSRGTNDIWTQQGITMNLVQPNNPCRDAVEASAAASAFGSADNRQHSGSIVATVGTTSFILPQGAGELLSPDDTYAVCYTEGDGSDTDAGWRDSYIRLKLSKIAHIVASDMTVTTRGLLANVPSLRIDWVGSLGFQKHLSLVDITENGGVPCDNAYAGASSHPTGSSAQSGKVQADASAEVVWIDATDLNGNGNMYTVCYSDDGGGTSGRWIDSGLRLGFVKWTNPSKWRLVSGAASVIDLQLNFAPFDSAHDKVSLLKDATDCSGALSAPALSNGDAVVRAVTSGYAGTVTLPSGTGVTDVNADGWRHCREHTVVGGVGGTVVPAQTCEVTGAYSDLNLNIGTYLICVCIETNGDGGCDSSNEWLKVGSPIDSAGVRIVGTPWLGRWQDQAGSHVDNLRSITGMSTVYSITGEKSAGFEIDNGDKLFFGVGHCGSIPSSNTTSYTSVLTLTMYDSDTSSASYGTARITLPSSPALTDDNGNLRPLVACFATSEGVNESPTAQDYMLLSDGLEIMPYPILSPEVDIKAVSGSAPSFAVDWLRPGDLIFFVETVESKGAESDCYQGSTAVDGSRVLPYPVANGPNGTTSLSGNQFDSLTDPLYPTGKLTLPSDTYLQSYATRPRFLTACFIPAGAIESQFSGVSCPVVNPTLTHCGEDLINVVRLSAQLHVFPEPVGALTLSWNQGKINELRFNEPQWGIWGDRNFSTGLIDDIVVLKQGDCTGVHELGNAEDYFLGTSYSAKMFLEDSESYETRSQDTHVRDEQGGALRTAGLATGKVNELAPGMYKICFASSSSEADDQEDFKELSVQIEILEADAFRPSLSVPSAVLLGASISVDWTSNIGLIDKAAAANSWIGLFRAGECNDGSEWQHQCYVASKAVASLEGSEALSGRVTFLFEEYKQAGEYDVRYFSGDTSDGQGRTCQGLQQSPHDTYVRCVLEPVVISQPFVVQPKMKEIQDLNAISGLEVVFEGSNRGRFANPW